MHSRIISLAPLQGFTEYPYRNALHQIIGGIDKYYTPYLRLQNDKTLKKKQLNDVLPENNLLAVIPQILTNNAEDFIYLTKLLSEFGYQEINLNLGCPFPMVTNRQLGSGLLNNPDMIKQMLDQALPKLEVKVSVKMRLGLNSSDEIYPVLTLLNNYPLSEIIIHPRIGKQLYKGETHPEIFKECLKFTKHNIAYNGDIDSPETFKQISEQFPTVNHFMIGRGMLNNPLLALLIKEDTEINSVQASEKLMEFHQHIYNHFSETLSGDAHLLQKMEQFWSYFSNTFENAHKVFKAIKKCKSKQAYNRTVMEILMGAKKDSNTIME